MEGFEFYKPKKWLSPTSLSLLARCPRKWFYRQGCRLQTPEHPALKFGEAIHCAIPHTYSGDLAKAMQAFMSVWGDRDALRDDKRNSTRARMMLMNFAATHQGTRSIYTIVNPPENNVKIADPISDNEIPFAIDVGIDLPIVGRIDGAGNHRDIPDELWGVEYKTGSEMSTRFLTSFDCDPQVGIYTLALSSLYNTRVRGVIIEGLLVAKTTVNSMSYPVYVNDVFLEDTIAWIQWQYAQLKSFEERKYFPKNRSACTPYPGFGSPGYMCEYASLCSVPDWTSLSGQFEIGEEKVFVLAQPTLEGKPITKKENSDAAESTGSSV